MGDLSGRMCSGRLSAISIGGMHLRYAVRLPLEKLRIILVQEMFHVCSNKFSEVENLNIG